MAKEKEPKEEKGGGKKPKRMHLKRIVSEEAHDGTYVHHHTYQKNREDPRTEEPERRNAATSQTAEEAGQHVTEQFGMNQGAGGAQEPDGDEAQAGGGAAPGADEEMGAE